MTPEKVDGEQENQIQWSIHKTNPKLADAAREKLSEIIDPEIGMSVIQLGLIRDISIEGDVAHLKVILTTPFCPYGPELIEAIRRQAEEAVNKQTDIEMLPDVWNYGMMEDPSLLDWGY